MEIFILAGQSNMAGRGRFKDLPPSYRKLAPNNEVMCFNAKGDWVQADEPLHRDVDLRKQDRCGVGPALVCARALLELRQASSPSSSHSRSIGLVPCAIGGASLDEWQQSYRGIVGDCEASTGPVQQRNHPWRYKPGSKNLFGAMAARAEEALRAAPEGSRLGGMLWYQGETDAAKEHRALTYYERFETLVKDIRGLGYPDLKIFTVAVTGANGRLPYLHKVREAQLRAGSAVGIPGVWVTDAFGLPMATDGLHLLTHAQVELGERMAREVFAATEEPRLGADEVQATIGSWTRDWVERDASISRAERDMQTMASMATPKHGSKPEAISQVTREVEEVSYGLANMAEGVSAASAHDGVSMSSVSPTRSSSEPAEKPPLGRSTQDATGVFSVSRASCSVSDDSKGIKTGPPESSSVRPGAGHQPPNVDKSWPGQHEVATTPSAGVKTAVQAEQKPRHGFVNSLSSEVQCRSYAKILFFLKPRPSPDDRLLVLGCGAGKYVMASALLYHLSQIQGIDSMQGCLDKARALLSVYSGNESLALSTASSDSPASPKADEITRRTPPSSIDLLEGDIAKACWDDASLVFVASCHFDDTMMMRIAKRCRALRAGARVITLDKPLPPVLSDYHGEDKGTKGEFRVGWQCQVEGCWGGSAVAYVHHRVRG